MAFKEPGSIVVLSTRQIDETGQPLSSAQVKALRKATQPTPRAAEAPAL